MKPRSSIAWGALLLVLTITSAALAQTLLPGTSALEMRGDLAAQMVDGIHAWLLEATHEAAVARSPYWRRDFSSRAGYERSVAANRNRLRLIIGAVDERLAVTALEFQESTSTAAQVAAGNGYKVFAVSWPVFKGVTGEGLLLQPDTPPVARVVAIPDAEWTPEMLAGLSPGVAPDAQFARRLAEHGCQVVIPVLIDRADTWSGIPEFHSRISLTASSSIAWPLRSVVTSSGTKSRRFTPWSIGSHMKTSSEACRLAWRATAKEDCSPSIVPLSIQGLTVRWSAGTSSHGTSSGGSRSIGMYGRC